jgi:hypothetical protein
MFGSKALEHGKAVVAATARAWRCQCWDCRAQRRHLLRLATLVVLVLGGSGGAVLEVDRWHRSLETPAAIALEEGGWWRSRR